MKVVDITLFGKLLNSRWLIVQPEKKKLGGRHLERIGYWLPRTTKTYDRAIIINKHRIKYWLGNGAICTPKVQKLLEHHNMVPKKPIPFGSRYTYLKPEQDFNPTYFKQLKRDCDKETWLKARIQDEINLKKRKQLLN